LPKYLLLYSTGQQYRIVYLTHYVSVCILTVICSREKRYRQNLSKEMKERRCEIKIILITP